MEWRTWEGTGKTENRGKKQFTACTKSHQEVNSTRSPARATQECLGFRKMETWDGSDLQMLVHTCRERPSSALGTGAMPSRGAQSHAPEFPGSCSPARCSSAPSMDPERSPGTRHITHTYTHTRTHTAVISFLYTGTSHLDQPYKGCP